MKKQLKIINLIIICLFISSMNIRAEVLSEVVYPETVTEHTSFTITIQLTYETTDDALYDYLIYLFYSINNYYVWSSTLSECLFDQQLDNLNPRPRFITFTIDCDELGLEAEDVFRFKYRYYRGVFIQNAPERSLNYVELIANAMFLSDLHTIIITSDSTDGTDTSPLNIYLLNILIPLAIISIILHKKRGKKQ